MATAGALLVAGSTLTGTNTAGDHIQNLGGGGTGEPYPVLVESLESSIDETLTSEIIDLDSDLIEDDLTSSVEDLQSGD